MLNRYHITINENSDTDNNLKVEITSPIDIYERYKLLINARNFHYENFSKWMTYFYVAIGALFVGYYTIKGKTEISELFPLLLAITGYIVSLLWYWSCKGYYYWNINFITLINHYEKDLLNFKEEERVYFVFANKNTCNSYLSPISGANISTSKVAIIFAFIVCIIWGIILFYEIESPEFILKFKDNKWCVLLSSFFLSVSLTLITSIFIPKKFLTSSISHMPDLKKEFKK